MTIAIYPFIHDVRDLPTPIATVDSPEAADAYLSEHGGVALCLPADEEAAFALEMLGWRGVFESEGWAYGERRMICRLA